ncbi:transcription-repair coupling factor [Ruoffia sp. FAM 20857]|uniref:transcription-repair coupling factor n=1 Tax=Ruoffia sp. FAM 20857 TaxID=3259515 RepID=UPI0038880470
MTTMYTQPFSPMINQINNSKDSDAKLLTGLDDSARSIFIAQQYLNQPQQYLVIEPRHKQQNELFEDLVSLLPDVPVLLFPNEESLAVMYSISSMDNTADRVKALNALASGKPCIIVASSGALRMRLTPVERWKDALITMGIGMDIEREDLEKLFNQYGYRREGMVQSPGEYSIRGSIVDFYPLNADHPVRLDFFDTELDSIRLFNAETQESMENIEQTEFYPAKDVIFTPRDQRGILDKLKKHLDKHLKKIEDEELKLQLKSVQKEQFTLLEQGEPLKYANAYLGFWDKEGTSLIDYLQNDARLIVMEMGRIQQNEFQAIEQDQFWIEQEISKGQLLPGVSIQLEAYEEIRQSRSKVAVQYFSLMQGGLANIRFSDVYAFQYRSMNQFFHQMPLIKAEMEQWLKQEKLVQVTVSTNKDAVKALNLFEEYNIHPTVIQEGDEPQTGAINIVTTSLAKGFELPNENWVVVTELELFNQLRRKKATSQGLSNSERIKSYNELDVGDYVVHLSHGIGRYVGIETMEISGVHKDLVAIEYEDNARVLLPVENINQLQKYVASESKQPRLNKLGGSEWKKTVRKVQAKVEDIADELITLYAEREKRKGYPFTPDTPEKKEFENAFPYVETADQLRSTKEIKKDMEKDKPMDRLLVGDVGYGKTEVAIRAIFKAVMDGKQVAFLVPTTILAQQHFNSIQERFSDWPFEIGMLSRFVSRAEQTKNIKKIKSGELSIIVGTHRLLSKDIEFNDLGLLIVDEEQRFGVKHKERLKQLKADVDVLTLTATPIPRTLHMSMIGVRDLSLIETPPQNRFPVQTYVMELNAGVVKTGIERELARGGQVFYLHNRVATIHQKAEEISNLVPDARVAVAHGQLSEVELERVLVDFIGGEYDVLVTTTIIETGVDIPNANTLFVENADHMGLSTLYQLRGRVGRTHRLAYAYLMYEPFKQLNEISEKRLNAIREFTELGSGFKIAMRDLSIRGAGDLLGKQQSGFIDSVGYDLYTQMLKEAVDSRQGHGAKTFGETNSFEWQVNIDAYIPGEYIDDDIQKIGVYKSIQNISSEEDYRSLQDELIDRFGEFPDEVSDLLDIALIKHYSIEAGIVSFTRKRQEVIATFNEEATKHLQGANIFQALQNVQLQAKVQINKNKLEVSLNVYNKDNDQWLSALINFTKDTADVLNQVTQEV